MNAHPINILAREIQEHVKVQAWEDYGDSPVPLQIGFDAEDEYPWTVKYVYDYVYDLYGTPVKRRWRYATGNTLEEALQNARRAQTERG